MKDVCSSSTPISVLAGITLDGRVDVDAFRCALTRFIDPGVERQAVQANWSLSSRNAAT